MLILHCGPMKTGSTAIQDLLAEQRDNLFGRGISYHHVKAKMLFEQLDRILEAEEECNNRIVLLSSEFFAQVDPMLLMPILDRYNFDQRHSIFLARPLRELYPSLYLQNLKGSSMRITSFKAFVNRQILLDQSPALIKGGQIMNFQYLDARLAGLNFSTHWIIYSRQSLTDDFLNLLGDLSGISLQSITRLSCRAPVGVSPRRSLRMEFSGIARVVNCLTKRTWLTVHQRELIMIALLNLSDALNRAIPRESFLTDNILHQCNLLDKATNLQFLMKKGLSMSSLKASK